MCGRNCNGFANWKKRGWKTAGKKPVKCRSLWKRLDAALGQHQIQWYGSKAMQAIPKTSVNDELARAAYEPRRKIVAATGGGLAIRFCDIAGWRNGPGG